MRKNRLCLILALCFAFTSATFFACDNDKNNSPSNSVISGIGRTAFTMQEKNRFTSAFGFAIPYVQNERYKIEDYEGYNGDLMAYENGLAFFADVAAEEVCEEYVQQLKDDEQYSFEYPQDGFYYFTRNDYFVKVAYNLQDTCWGLEVYVYSYTFEDNQSSDTATDSGSFDTGTDTPDTPTTGFKYEKHSDSYSIIGFYGDEDGVVEIPDVYEGLPVCYIRGNAFYGAEDITELIVGDNVLSIEGNAFMLCINLEKVTLGNSLTLIDRQAFYGCAVLEEIVIPASVTFIGSGAFGKCDALTSVILEDKTGWKTSSKQFEEDELFFAETVADYFTDRYKSEAWQKED